MRTAALGSNSLTKPQSPDANAAGTPLQQAVWTYLVLMLLFVFGLAQLNSILLVVGMALAAVMFLSPFFGNLKALDGRLLIAAVTFATLITALYPPVLGFFMGLVGYSNVLMVKILLGLRSAFFSLWMLSLCVFIHFRDRKEKGSWIVLAILWVLATGSLVGKGSLEPRVTYLLNSFIPLLSTLAVLPVLMARGDRLQGSAKIVERIALAIAFLCIIYYPILTVAFDVFRPDLALYHQSSSSYSGASSEAPTQWQSLLYGMRVPRFVGTFPNPILFGYFCAVASFAFFVQRRYWLSGLLVLLIIGSVSKGALLLLISAHALLWASKKGRGFFWTAFLGIVVVELAMAYLLDGSNRVHLRGLQGGIKSVLEGGPIAWVFGFGIGSGGNLARGSLSGGVFSSGWLASGSESGVGVLVYQLGGGGLALFLLLARNIFFFRNEGPPDVRVLAVQALCAAWLGNMLLQEDLINVTVISQMLFGIVMLMAAKPVLPSKVMRW